MKSKKFIIFGTAAILALTPAIAGCANTVSAVRFNGVKKNLCDPTTVSVNISDYASENGWVSGTKYTSINIDNNISATASGESNTGKYYTNTKGNAWRIYGSEKGKITISSNSLYIINSITLTFTNAGLTYDTNNVTSGESVTINANEAEFFATGVTRITDIEVTYSALEVETYKISFNSNGGSTLDDLKVKQNSTTSSLPTPTKSNDTSNQIRYEFDGWYLDNETFQNEFVAGETTVNSDITLYAKWTEIHYYTVTFANTDLDDALVDEGGNKVSKPIDPTKDGSIFEGWYVESDFQNEFDFENTLINGNTTIYAKWTDVAIQEDGSFFKVTSTAEVTNGRYLFVYEADEIAFNGNLTELDSPYNTVPIEIDNNGYISKTNSTASSYFTYDSVAGSFKSASGFYIGKTANSNGLDSSKTTVYTNTVEIDNDGNVVLTASGNTTLRYNSAAGDNNKRFRFYKSGQQPIQLYKFGQECTVTFETNGGTLINSITTLSGKLIDAPSTPTKDGYTFAGWFDENNKEWDFEKDIVSNNLVLTAKWLDNTQVALQEGLNNIDSYFSLGYKYTATPTNSNFLVNAAKKDRPSDDGNEINNANSFLAEIDGGKLPTAISYVNSSKIYGGKENTLKFGTSSNNGSLEFSSTSNINKVIINAKAYNDKGEGTLSVNGSDGKTLTTTFDNYEFDLASTKSITITSVKRLYIASIEFIIESYDYSNVDVRLKVATDSFASFNKSFTAVTDYGIEVSTASKTKKYAYNENTYSETKGENDYQYNVISLGDAINNPDRLSEKFTIRAFAKYEEDYYYSSLIKTYSVVDLVETYYDAPSTKDMITPLYDVLVSLGKIA